MHSRSVRLATVLVSGLMAFAPLIPCAADTALDLRVVVDVSGSMKQNDPDNLRVVAVKLLTGLLPDRSRAGVWTFGKYVNMPVPLAQVDQAWRSQVHQQVGSIHSKGMFTNIEQALELSTFDWTEPDPATRRNVILLSDGRVDVGPDPEKNAQSRAQILQTILPRLRDAGVVVHAIALSDGADQELLETLALSTGGWYESVQSAETLHRIFLHLFEKVAPGPGVPLDGDSFSIDDRVRDLTLVAFHQPGDPPIGLIAPSGAQYQANMRPSSIHWQTESQFDIVTIDKPEAGVWRLHAPQDSDNRVMVATNLDLVIEAFPRNVVASEKVLITAHLREDGALIVQPALLKVVDFELTQYFPDGSQTVTVLRDDGKDGDQRSGDGLYTAALPETGRVGIGEIAVSARAPTFQRQARRTFLIRDLPVSVSVEALGEPAHAQRLLVEAGEAGSVLGVEGVRVYLEPQRSALELQALAPNRWTMTTNVPLTEEIELEIHGTVKGDRPFAVRRSERLTLVALPKPTERQVSTPPSTPQAGREILFDWSRVFQSVLIFNGVFFSVATAVVVVWLRQRRRIIEELDEELVRG